MNVYPKATWTSRTRSDSAVRNAPANDKASSQWVRRTGRSHTRILVFSMFTFTVRGRERVAR